MIGISAIVLVIPLIIVLGSLAMIGRVFLKLL